jgi:molybdopterin-guanine dinucleotide biosynthesis protein A
MGRDKALVQVGGETLLVRAARHLVQAGSTELVVASGTPGRLGPLPWTEVDDGEFAGHGPLAGLVAALDELSATTTDTALVLAVDLPDASARLLGWLADELVVTGVPGLIPLDPIEGRPQPLHAAYRPSAVVEPLRAALRSGNRRVLRALASAGAVQVAVPTDLAGAIPRTWHRNVNSPLDLRRRRE